MINHNQCERDLNEQYTRICDLLNQLTTKTAELEAAQKRIERLEAALQLTQWGDGQADCCQLCFAYKDEGRHTERCLITKALSPSKQEQEPQ